jgi:hypothetical protein
MVKYAATPEGLCLRLVLGWVPSGLKAGRSLSRLLFLMCLLISIIHQLKLIHLTGGVLGTLARDTATPIHQR